MKKSYVDNIAAPQLAELLGTRIERVCCFTASKNPPYGDLSVDNLLTNPVPVTRGCVALIPASRPALLENIRTAAMHCAAGRHKSLHV